MNRSGGKGVEIPPEFLECYLCEMLELKLKDLCALGWLEVYRLLGWREGKIMAEWAGQNPEGE